MKVIVTASRTWDNEEKMFQVLNALLILSGKDGLEVIHGGADGGDRMASRWVRIWTDVAADQWPHVRRLGPVTEKVYPVTREQWQVSRAAGFHRNTRMVVENRDAGVVVAFSRAGSRGTAHCVSQALHWELPVWFIDYDLDPPRAPNPVPSWWPAKGI